MQFYFEETLASDACAKGHGSATSRRLLLAETGITKRSQDGYHLGSHYCLVVSGMVGLVGTHLSCVNLFLRERSRICLGSRRKMVRCFFLLSALKTMHWAQALDWTESEQDKPTYFLSNLRMGYLLKMQQRGALHASTRFSL